MVDPLPPDVSSKSRVPDPGTASATPGWSRPSGSWASSEANRRVMQANRSRDTRPELMVRRAVHAMGLRFYVARRPVADIRISADMVFPGPRVAVFIDGCFWHGCPDHASTPRTNVDYWRVKIAANRDRDVRAGRLLGIAGWTVIRVWEHDDPRRSAARVREVVAALRAATRPRRRRSSQGR